MLRIRALLAAVLLGWSAMAAAEAPRWVNLADDFVRFWDATQTLAMPDRVEAFKRDVGARLPAFYGIARFDGAVSQDRYDQRIAEAIARFPAIRADYLAKAAAFDASLQRDSASFLRAFPDFAPHGEIYLLHSLGEMDGGTRTLDGKSVLIFGVDGIASFHQGWASESPFFHHELFHLYHEPRLGECNAIWCALWGEGLATHVAERLNPGTGEAELLLTYPNGMAARTRAALLPSLQALLPVLDSEDDKVYAELFNGGEEMGLLPRRRGYYLGLLVAREIGRQLDLRAMANLPAARAKPLVRAAVQRLIANARAARPRG